MRGELDRTRLHPLHRGPLARALGRWREGLKDSRQRQEEEADRLLARRYTLTDTNCIAVASNKGGSGKTTISLLLGEVLASRRPNQRALAVDFNPWGIVLLAVPPDPAHALAITPSSSSRSC